MSSEFGRQILEGTTHGDEEAIEHCSDRLYPVLRPFASSQTSQVRTLDELGERTIDAARWRLHGEGHDWAVIDKAQEYAASLIAYDIDRERDQELKRQLGHDL